jgi:type IV pilus assembly protein PilV
MVYGNRRTQTGIGLIEVLVSVLILAIGLLGAAALQLNSLKYTDSSTMSSQASFIAYDMMDRIRANPCSNALQNPCSNPAADYALASLASAPTSFTSGAIRNQDWFDFATNVKNFAGTGADGSISVAAGVVTITITWNDSRAANVAGTLQTFTLVSGTSTVWSGL